MGGDNVERVWFGLCLIKAIVTLFVVSLVVLLCWRFLRSLPSNRVRWGPPKHPMVHVMSVDYTRERVNIRSLSRVSAVTMQAQRFSRPGRSGCVVPDSTIV